MKQLLMRSKSEDRTGEMGVIEPAEELSDSEQLSQISRFEGYVQIEDWEKIESTDDVRIEFRHPRQKIESSNNVRIEFRYPNGKVDETFFDWPEDSFKESEFGRFVHQMGYTAETADMISESHELFPYEDGELQIDDINQDNDINQDKVFTSFRIFLAIIFLIGFPIVMIGQFMDTVSGIHLSASDKMYEYAMLWFAVCGFVWGAFFALAFLV